MAFSLSDLFSFNPDGSYAPASNFVPPGAGGFDPNTYSQNDQGQVTGWSPSEASRRGLIDQAYTNQQSGNNSTTSFADFGRPPQQLGNDVISALAASGLWTPPGTDPSSKNPFIQANRLDDGSIMVADPRGGDGRNPNYYYDSTGKFQKTGIGSKIMSGAQGILSVAGAAAGFGALGAMAGGGALTLPQAAGAASLVPKNIAPDVLGSSPNIQQPSFGQSTMPNGFSSSLGGLSNLFSGNQSGGNMALGDGGTPPNPFATGQGGGFQDMLSGLFGGNSGGLGSLISSMGGLGNIGANLLPGVVGANQKNQAGQAMIDFLNQQQSKMDSSTANAQGSFMDFLKGQQSNLSGLANQARDSTLGTLQGQQTQIGQQANQSRDATMQWLAGQQANINNMYNPGTPEANMMQQEMDRKDAAAGRNSQYGVRSTDLAAKLATLKGNLNTQFATGVANTVGQANNLPANLLNQFATGTSGALGAANNLPVNAASQFADASVGPVNNSLNQGASNTLNFTTGTSKALADALGVRSGAFNSLLSGIGALNESNQQARQGGSPTGSGGGIPPGLGQAAGAIGSNFGSLSDLFNRTFGNNASDSLTGGLGSVPFGQGFNFSNPILDSNGVGSLGSVGGTGIGFGNFGSGLDQFSGSPAFSDLSDISDWFL